MFEVKVNENINQGSFETIDEVKKSCVKVDYVNGKAEAGGVGMISDGKTAYVFDDDGFSLTIGGTGSKKTRCVVGPFVYNNALAGNSMIITDVKGDLYRNHKKSLEKLGYKIRVLNFNEPEKGDAYNPMLSIVRDYKNGRKDRANKALNNLAEMIFSTVRSERDPYWTTSAANYFTGNMLTMFDIFEENQITIDNAINIHVQGSREFRHSTYMNTYYSGRENTEAYKLMIDTLSAPKDTRASIVSTYTSALNRLMGQNQGLAKMMSHSTFEIKNIVDNKTAIFIIANEESLSVHGNLITAIIQQWYDNLVSIADRSNGVLTRKVAFVLDEFGNLPALRDFQTTISLSRARGITFMVVIQSFAQLELRYGKEVAQTIVGNCSNWIYLFSPDIEILTHISRLCGEITDEYTGKSRTLLSVNQLRHLKKINEDGLTECLMLMGRLNPFIGYLPDISEYYGIEPIEVLDIPMRSDKDTEPINFSRYVEDEIAGYNKSILKKRVDEYIERLRSQNKKDSVEDAQNFDKSVDDIINAAISEVRKEMNEDGLY